MKNTLIILQNLKKFKEIKEKKQFKEIQGNFLIVQGNQGIQGRVGPLCVRVVIRSEW